MTYLSSYLGVKIQSSQLPTHSRKGKKTCFHSVHVKDVTPSMLGLKSWDVSISGDKAHSSIGFLHWVWTRTLYWRIDLIWKKLYQLQIVMQCSQNQDLTLYSTKAHFFTISYRSCVTVYICNEILLCNFLE